MMLGGDRTGGVMVALTVVFCCLAVSFTVDLWGRPRPLLRIERVAPEFLETTTWRQSYADLVRAEEDVDYFDCYICHDEEKKTELRYDARNQLVIAEEHNDIVMGHGTHGRNNNCFNCHNDDNLLLLQMRDGQELSMENSTLLCGSCHGPTLRDWTSGSHGRTSGYWDRSKGGFKKLDCVNCHDPHSPEFPGRKPAPGPHHLREMRGGSPSIPTTGHSS